MASRLVQPNEPSIQKVERTLPALPQSEAHRIRRASRNYADYLLPEAMKVLADALLSDDMEDRKWAFDRIAKMTLAPTPNETVDPESTVIDGESKTSEALKELEKATESGTGLPDE